MPDPPRSIDLDFIYDDADTHANEIAELYSYTEQPELQLNLTVGYCKIFQFQLFFVIVMVY